jgi:uncharacterized protein
MRGSLMLLKSIEPPPFWKWRDVLMGVAIAIPLVMVVAGSTAFLISAVFPAAPKAVAILAPQFLGFATILLPLAFLFRTRYDRPLFESLRFGVPQGEAAKSLVQGIGLAILVLALGAALRPPRIRTPLEDLMSDPASAPILAIAAVTIGPFFEELFFRGLLQPLFVRDTGVIAGVLLSALPFALLHGPEYSWSWRHVLLVGVAGTAFGFKRYISGSTGAATITHAAYNAVITTGYLLGRKVIDA